MEAKRDKNRIATLLGVSNVDGETPITLWADPVTHRLLVDLPVSSGTTAPSSTPVAVGQMYVDTTAKKVYVSVGTTSSADWSLLN